MIYEKIFSAIQGKRHVIWDWNGTLLDDVGHAVAVMNSLLKEHELPQIDRDYYRKIFDFPVLGYYQALGFDFEKESFESLCHKFVDRFMDGFQSLPLNPGMRSMVIKLRQEGVMQSILSATDQPNLNSMISHFELGSIFEFVFGIDNKLAASKVDRGHELIRLSQISKDDTLIIGDTLHDLEVAKALEIDVVLVAQGHQCSSRLRPHHQRVIEV